MDEDRHRRPLRNDRRHQRPRAHDDDRNVSLAIRNADGGSNVLARIASEVSAAAYDAIGAMADVDDHWGNLGASNTSRQTTNRTYSMQ